MTTKCEPCKKEFSDQAALEMHNSAKHNIPLKGRSSGISGKFIIAAAVILALVLIGFFAIPGKGATGNAISLNGDVGNSGVQKVNIGFGRNYDPNTITVKAGTPVEITLDSSVGGCFRAFDIPGLSVRKYSKDPSDKITFTPTTKGEFEYRCSMGMGTGKIIVE